MNLFRTKNGQNITEKDFENALEKLNVHNAKYALLEVILSTGVENIIFPTFTFSFPNKEDYSVLNSKTLMGGLNEFARKDSRAIRSVDPIMSNIHFGKDRTLVTEIGKYSCGEGSTYHKLEQSDNVLFLFFGVHPSLCFTYSHFIEERLKVPYRYNQDFTGKITDASGRTYEDTYKFFVRCKDVVAGTNPKITEEAYKNGALKEAQVGDSFLYTYDKDKITDIYVKGIKNDINFMLGAPMPKDLIKEYVVEQYPVIAM